MFLLDNKKIDINAQRTIDGVTYPNLRDPVLRDKLGVVEVPDPTYPEPADEYYVTENEDGSLNITPKSPEQIARQNDAKARDAAQRHLDETEYLFNMDRHAELLSEEPQREAELRASRAAARKTIRDYKAKYPEAV